MQTHRRHCAPRWIDDTRDGCSQNWYSIFDICVKYFRNDKQLLVLFYCGHSVTSTMIVSLWISSAQGVNASWRWFQLIEVHLVFGDTAVLFVAAAPDVIMAFATIVRNARGDNSLTSKWVLTFSDILSATIRLSSQTPAPFPLLPIIFSCFARSGSRLNNKKKNKAKNSHRRWKTEKSSRLRSTSFWCEKKPRTL